MKIIKINFAHFKRLSSPNTRLSSTSSLFHLNLSSSSVTYFLPTMLPKRQSPQHPQFLLLSPWQSILASTSFFWLSWQFTMIFYLLILNVGCLLAPLNKNKVRVGKNQTKREENRQQKKRKLTPPIQVEKIPFIASQLIFFHYQKVGQAMRRLLLILLIAILTTSQTATYNAIQGSGNTSLDRQLDGLIDQIDKLGQQSSYDIRQYLVYKMNQTSKTPLCGASSSGQLTSGQITLNSAAGSNQYTYTYSQTLNSLQQSVASVSMSSFSVQFSNSVSFSIQKTENRGTGFNFSFESGSNNQWNQMKLAFVVTNRPDIELGSASYDANASSQGVVTYRLKNQWEDSSRLQVVTFLTGFTGGSNTGAIGYLITGHSITNNLLTISLKFQTNTRITRLTLDLVILDPFNSDLRFQHRQIVDTYVSSTHVGYLPAVQSKEQRIQLLGLTAFAIEGSIQLSLQSEQQTGNSYSLLKYGPLGSGCSFNYLSLAYLVVSFNPCGFCPGQTYTYQGQCIKACPHGTRPTSNYTCEPIVCPDDSYLHSDNTCHSCPAGTAYSPVQGICVTICQSYERYDLVQMRCICISGYYLINSRCQQCPANTQYNSSSQSCQPICQANEFLSNGRCVCMNGYYLIGGRCQQCPTNTLYNASTFICQPICQANELLSNGQCICLSGYYRIAGRCQQCPANTIYNSTLGICHNQCFQNQLYNITLGQCVCLTGYYLINNRCQQCPAGTIYDSSRGICRVPCTSNQQYSYSLGRCVCLSGYYLIGGTCQQCPSGTVYDSSLNRCRIPCSSNEQYSTSRSKCECLSGFYLIGGRCQQCPAGTIYDQTFGICRVPCSTNEQYNISLSRCVCLSGYYLINNRCQQCPSGTIYDSSSSSCRVPCGIYQQYSTTLAKCVCLSGYYLINNRCQQCPSNTIYDIVLGICRLICRDNQIYSQSQSKCICQDGYYIISGVCGRCPQSRDYDNILMRCVLTCTGSNEVYDSWLDQCVCRDSYHRVNNICQLCPSNQFYYIYPNGTGQCFNTCPQRQYFNPLTTKCECSQGYYNISGYCDVCPSGKSYQRVSQTCIPSCPKYMVYSILKGQCVCIDGYGLRNGYCMDCGPCSQVNPFNGLCECAPTYYWIEGVCGACPIGSRYDSGRQRCTVDCPAHSSYDELTGRCICQAGYNMDWNNNLCISSCPSGQYYSSGQCICSNPNQVMYNHICYEKLNCPANSYFHVQSYCCLCNQGYRFINGSCVNFNCGPNSYDYNGLCVCVTGYYMINKQCLQCGSNEQYNGIECVCRSGYSRNGQGACVLWTVPVCGRNQVYSYAEGRCVCAKGCQYLMGNCEIIPSCPAYANFNGISCVCQTGYLMQNGQCLPVQTPVPTCPVNSQFNGVSCSCKAGYFEIRPGQCGKCPSGSYWNGNQCSYQQTCSQGCVVSPFNNQCIPVAQLCGPNANWNGATCCCLQGYNLINNQCVQCPTGTWFDGRACSSFINNTCPSNEIMVNGVCQCASSFYRIQGVCTQCPSYTQWNGLYCQAIGSDGRNWCMGNPFSIQTSLGCRCESGYYNMDGLCVRH